MRDWVEGNSASVSWRICVMRRGYLRRRWTGFVSAEVKREVDVSIRCRMVVRS